MVPTLGELTPSPEPGAPTADSLVTIASGELLVESLMRPADMDLLRVGMPVELLDESTKNAYPATIASIAGDAAVGTDGEVGHLTVIEPVTPLSDAATGSNLRVTITTATTAGNSLIVPLAAISSSPDGTTRVSLLPAPDETPIEVDVVAGISADGFVAIEATDPGALVEGDLVVVGR